MHIQNIIPEDLCAHLRKRIDERKPGQETIQNVYRENITGKLEVILIKVASMVSDVTGESLQIQPCYTVSRHMAGTTIGWHYDKKKYPNDKYKCVCYVSKDPPPTQFQYFNNEIYIPHNICIGDIVVFDMDLYHRGSFGSKTKYLLGARLGTSLT